MSKLRERLQKLAYGYDNVDYDDGQNKPNENYVNYMKEKRDNMQLSDSQVMRDFPDAKYKNGAGMVSPLNIIVMDYANSLYNMPFNEAVSFVLDNIEALNAKYKGDAFYDTFSESSGGYFRKMKYTMENLKPKTTTKLIEYLQNAMYKGMSLKN